MDTSNNTNYLPLDNLKNKENDYDIENAIKALTVKSTNIECRDIVKGYDFNNGINYSEIFSSYKYMGFQATALGNSIEIINKMINWRLSHEKIEEDESKEYLDQAVREKTRCTIFLGYTSNMASCGMREILRYLCEHKMIDCIVTTAGEIEEDFIKCLRPTFIGDFHLKGSELREKGINRIGN